ncbi:Tetratricopeptide repeat protein [Cordyceps javanica]|uniref:Tetratricopeptide repeat protein n=1 Tax=Cordyceps javanica TaxID=43265 RepID=A0A545VQY4_9HYPO|nr:Tetratricopeptide repeat protein [Cordyceps javanica]TQW04151.1 Tetratricopeptide repeat protein [Cordyceps javanica]
MADALEPLRGFIHRVKGSVSRRRGGDRPGLHVVLDPSQAEIDIVAVHGLGDQGFRAWTTRDPRSGSSRPWLEELLGADMPRARIMTYNYSAGDGGYRYIVCHLLDGGALSLNGSLGALRRRDGTSRRPLFFIAHSLGGWFVKRALILSAEATDPLLREVELSTCGVAFFGTIAPGRPSSPSPLAHVIRRTSGPDKDGASPMRVRPDDLQWLERQMSAFKCVAANLPRIAFYETKTSDGSFVVEKKHSMTGSDGAQIGLVASHSDLIGFEGRDANYASFIDRFREMVSTGIKSGFMDAKRKAADVTNLRLIDFRHLGYSVPYQVPNEPECIVPRDDIMQNINSIFNPGPKRGSVSFRFAHLWGKSGFGKTTLAKHYTKLHRNDISFVFWVWAESWETAAGSYLDFANNIVTYYLGKMSRDKVEERLGLMGVSEMVYTKSILHLDKKRVMSVVQAVKDWLMQPDNSQWLIVFDGVEPIYNVQDFIPLTLSGRVILTSKEEKACTWGSKVAVQPMSENQALELLSTGTGCLTFEKGEKLAAAKKLTQRLDFHPASIAQAASTLRMKKTLVSDYERIHATTPHPRVFGSTIDQHPASSLILRISALLSSSPIPASLFLRSLQDADCIPPHFNKSAGELKSLQTEKRLDDVLEHLIEQQFMYPVYTSDSSQPSSASDASSSPTSTSSTSTTFFMMDADAREFVRNNLAEDDRAEHAWLACNVCVNGVRKASDASSTLREVHTFGRAMAPHAKACFDDCSPALEERPELESVSWHVLGNVCMTQGAVAQAIGCFKLALQHADSMEPLEKIQTSLSLSQLLEQCGQTDQSIKVLTTLHLESVDEALSFRVALAKATANVARGEFSEAEDQFEVLEHEQEEALGPVHAETVGTIQMLAHTLRRMGRVQDAHVLYRRVYTSYQNIFGHGHPMTLGSLDDLAEMSREVFAVDEAEALLTQSIDIKTRCLGLKHPRTALAIQSLAEIDDLLARYPAAQAKYKKALDMLSPTLGRAHPDCVLTMENMARSLHLQGRFLQERLASLRAAAKSSSSSSSPTMRSLPSRRRRRSSHNASAEQHAAEARGAVLHDATRQRAFRDAERLYLEVVGIKKAARDLYSEESLMMTVSDVVQMYEVNVFFEAERAEKIPAVTALLHESRRRGTV